MASLLGVILLLITARELFRKRMDTGTFVMWSILWIALILTGVFPEPYTLIVAWLGMSTPIHFVTSFGIVILLAISYQLYRRVNELNSKLTRTVQELALLGANRMKHQQEPAPDRLNMPDGILRTPAESKRVGNRSEETHCQP